ncbi:MAG: hypothetical protein FJW30_28025 [Acidobacteria bacterium]|nr:hypothetical protein [Acidobacteriota bacterium]
MRFSLDAPETKLVPLEREMKIVTDFLEIERTRFGDRLRYEIDADGPAISVPPLSIQTLVENSVKHVIAKRREGGVIQVRVAAGAGRVRVEIADGGPGLSEADLQPGHGLEILRARLHALFPGQAALSFRPGAVHMEFPQ